MSSTECRCPYCFGLAEYMLNVTGKDYGLPHAEGHGPPIESPFGPVCDGSMTCKCPSCVEERGKRRPVRIVQPWEIAA